MFTNLPLPYAFDALEPFIDAETMELHHDRHLQTYIDNLNAAIADYPALHSCTAARLSAMNTHTAWKPHLAISRNAGGVFNHRFFFLGMTPDAGRRALCGALETAAVRRFKTRDALEHAFSEAALSVFGSGYAWLVCDRSGRLLIVTTANQETPMTRGLRPLLCCDVWEHAYYLKHKNRRADYIRDWLCVADWARADALFTGAAPCEV